MNGGPIARPDLEGLARLDPDTHRPIEADEHRRAWAVAATLASPGHAPSPGAASGSPATDWRPGAVSLTDLADEISRGLTARGEGSVDPVAPAVVSRLETAVSTAELGRVSFTVDRSNDGLSIVVEVQSDRAAAAVDQDRSTLLRTLRLAGLTVLSFRVLVRGEAGPALAQRPGSSHARPGLLSVSRYSRARRPEPDDPDEGVDVVG